MQGLPCCVRFTILSYIARFDVGPAFQAYLPHIAAVACIAAHHRDIVAQPYDERR